MESLLLFMCFACWVVPLIALGVFYGVTRSILITAQTRGASGDGLYCCKCRFDLRGNAGWDCPECGEHLDRLIGPGYPRGGVIVKDMHPPINRAVAVLLYIVAGFVPVVSGLIVLGLILPINYETYSVITISTPNAQTHSFRFQPTEVSFYGERERSWSGQGDFKTLTYDHYSPDGQSQMIPLPANTTLEQLGEQFWTRVVSPAWQSGDAQLNEYRDEFLDLFQLIAESKTGQLESASNLYQVGVSDYTNPSFHPLFTWFLVISMVVTLVGLAWWALRDCRQRDHAYQDKVKSVRERMVQTIEQNLERMRDARQGN